MKSRDLVRFFFSVLAVGAVITSVVGFALEWGKYQKLFISFEILEIACWVVLFQRTVDLLWKGFR